jgi:hypothetical protein
MQIILTVIPDKESDLTFAGIAAAALCGGGITSPFPDGLPSRPTPGDRGSIEVTCEQANGPLARAGFIQAGFDTIEKLPMPTIPPKTNPVTIKVGPEDQKYLQFGDSAADALLGAGLTIAFPDGSSYQGDLAHDSTMSVMCASADTATVQRAFAAAWQMLAGG